MTLQFEYSCTEKELKEAKSLQECQVYGGGRKWRANIVMAAFLLIAGTDVVLRFETEVKPGDRLGLFALLIVIVAAFLIFKRITRRKAGAVVQVEVSERGLTFSGDKSRTEMLWPAFSQCLESANLFVLINRSKTVLFTIPKRAFPDEKSQEWFRALANQRPVAPEAAMTEPMVPGRFVASGGITLMYQLKYHDYLVRNITSWRFKGIFAGMFVLFACIAFLTPPSPDAVNSPMKTMLIAAPILGGMLIVIVFAMALISWLAEKKHLTPQCVVMTSDGIQFADRDASGKLPWSTYKYFREGRWGFFVWQPQGSVWAMFPKRAFASISDLDQCRALLQTNLKKSLWFYL